MIKEMDPTAKGKEIISLLRQPDKIIPKLLVENETLTAEDGTTAFWPTFIPFPTELSAIFPGSYISPAEFLTNLNYSSEAALRLQKTLLSKVEGEFLIPILDIKDKSGGNNFSLTVLNGSTNEYALAMTEFAYLGFDDPKNRLQYQHHMLQSVKPFYADKSEPKYRVRIFDDCLASGDSIAGYLYKLCSEENPLLKQGVEVMVVTATAQSILFLKSFAQSLGIDLSIKVGQLAFGLSEGTTKNNGVREHANYITYPKELLKLLPEEIAKQLESYQIDINGEKLIQVVGDMGAAEEGIQVEELREMLKDLPSYIDYWWNDRREDPHGRHPMRKDKLPVTETRSDRPISVYLARGGYLPYAWDKFYGLFDKLDAVVVRASRLWTKEHGYGVGIRPE